ncbi:MAG TPA: nucleotidyl transferase AbiEii/AbiGii toxin family protein [Desulfohalobiaceae bacterium]|nr:nucleotidyl transferase AbiEii/AbiGii toxin family protein [Desulfohalobiaceae bacterium]
MNILQKHELLEIEVLDLLHRFKALEPLVFGGGSMLRLCHDLNRYSVDLDFWFIKDLEEDEFFEKVRESLEKDYEITDAQMKHLTLIFELRTSLYPKRLKIEIRRGRKNWDFQEKIAFSRFSTRQVILKSITLKQSMKNKVSAFLDRGEIRDCFDIEFLLRKGLAMPSLDPESLKKFQKKLQGFKKADFKVKLGSILEEDMRRYYIANGFSYLQEKLQILE